MTPVLLGIHSSRFGSKALLRVSFSESHLESLAILASFWLPGLCRCTLSLVPASGGLPSSLKLPGICCDASPLCEWLRLLLCPLEKSAWCFEVGEVSTEQHPSECVHILRPWKHSCRLLLFAILASYLAADWDAAAGSVHDTGGWAPLVRQLWPLLLPLTWRPWPSLIPFSRLWSERAWVNSCSRFCRGMTPVQVKR